MWRQYSIFIGILLRILQILTLLYISTSFLNYRPGSDGHPFHRVFWVGFPPWSGDRLCIYHWNLPLSFVFFFHKGFAVPLSYPLFDPAVPFIAIPLQMAYPTPPPAPPVASSLASFPQLVPSISLDDDDPLEVAGSYSSSSFEPSDDYTPAKPDMANRFLSSESD